MTVGFVGLGTMGKPMALNIVKGGYALTVFDLHAEAVLELERAGARAAAALSDIADCEVVCLCLPGSRAVESVLYGAGGILAKLKPGQIVIDFSTVFCETTLKLAKDFERLNVRFLDAPISGMKKRAVDGTLTVMCGGDILLFEEMRPLLEKVGTEIVYTGANGNGQFTKLVNQLLFDINVAALAEILPMAVKLGLDPQKTGEVVNSGTGRSYASEFFIPKTLKGIFDDGYPMEDAYKDLISASAIGMARGIPLPILSTATATYQTALLKGYGRLSKGGMIKVFEELLGVEFREEGAENEIV